MAEFLKEQGGRIVSILAAEYDEEIAKRVYGEELLENERIKIARNLLRMSISIEQIASGTGLTIKRTRRFAKYLLNKFIVSVLDGVFGGKPLVLSIFFASIKR